MSASVHPTLQYFVSVAKDRKWRLWDINRAEVVAAIEEASLAGNYTAGELHPDGLILAAGTEDAVVRLFDYRSQGKEVARFPSAGAEGHQGAVAGLSFSENGYLLASAAADGARVWDLRKLK